MPLALLTLAAIAAANWPGIPAETVILLGDAPVFRLTHPAVVIGTDSVFVDGSPLDREEYRVDWSLGTVAILKPVARWSVVRVSYRTLDPGSGLLLGPVEIPELDTSGTAEPDSFVAMRPETVASGSLDVNGSKLLGVTVGGPGGSGLKQVTSLNVTGTLEGVDIEASLSDQSSPIPAEGTTRELDELDRLYIRLRGKTWRGDFGDVRLRSEVPGFGAIERRATGGQAAVSIGPVEVGAGYARPRGEHVHVDFRGLDGVQGPYRLSEAGDPVTVVPGTERVFLDGMPLVRGWDQDYTIDYSLGELTFTTAQVVGSVSRIEVSFQQATDAYQRDDVVGSARVRLGPADVSVGLFRESDDPDQSLLFEYTDEQLVYLASIGGDTSLAWLDGGTRVAQGDGAWELDEGGGFYRHVGEGNGNYRVLFSFVGDSAGDYVYDDTLFHHVHVGEGNGDYAARFRAELPTRQEWAHARAGLELGGLSGSVGGVFVRRSRNLFAPDGAAQSVPAGNAELDWNTGRFRASYRGRLRSEGLGLQSADTAFGFEERWAGTKFEQTATLNELGFEAGLGPRVRLGLESGLLTSNQGPNVGRVGAELRADWAQASVARAGSEMLYRVGATPAFGILRPSARGRWRHAPGGGDLDALARAGVVLDSRLSGGVELRHARTDTVAQGSREWYEQSWLATGDVDWRLDERLRMRARLGRQTRTERGGGNWERWLGEALATVTPARGTRVQGDFSQSYGLIGLSDEMFRYVGEGLGGYALDSVTGRYYVDPEGSYERVVVPTGGYATSRDRRYSLSVEAGGWEPVSFRGSVTGSGSDTDTTEARRALSYSASMQLRAFRPDVVLDVGVRRSSSADNTLAFSGKDVSRLLAYAEARSGRFGWFAAEARIELLDDLRLYGDARVEFSETAWKVSVEPVLGSGTGTELLLEYQHSSLAEPVYYPELGTFLLRTARANVGRSVRIGKGTRIRADAGGAWRTATVDSLPFDVQLSRPLGIVPEASLAVSQVINDFLDGSARYRFFDRSDRAADHEFSLEVTARF